VDAALAHEVECGAPRDTVRSAFSAPAPAAVADPLGLEGPGAEVARAAQGVQGQKSVGPAANGNGHWGRSRPPQHLPSARFVARYFHPSGVSLSLRFEELARAVWVPLPTEPNEVRLFGRVAAPPRVFPLHPVSSALAMHRPAPIRAARVTGKLCRKATVVGIPPSGNRQAPSASPREEPLKPFPGNGAQFRGQTVEQAVPVASLVLPETFDRHIQPLR